MNDTNSDVPLKSAMVVWTQFDPRFPEGNGRVAVVKWPDLNGASKEFLNSDCACGASIWQTYSEREQFAALMLAAWIIVMRDGISPKEMHAALSVIPEYRQMTRGSTVHEIWN